MSSAPFLGNERFNKNKKNVNKEWRRFTQNLRFFSHLSLYFDYESYTVLLVGNEVRTEGERDVVAVNCVVAKVKLAGVTTFVANKVVDCAPTYRRVRQPLQS